MDEARRARVIADAREFYFPTPTDPLEHVEREMAGFAIDAQEFCSAARHAWWGVGRWDEDMDAVEWRIAHDALLEEDEEYRDAWVTFGVLMRWGVRF